MSSPHVVSGLDLQQSLVAAGVGAITFPVVLGFNQVAIFSPLRLSTRTPLVLASALGGLSVTTAAVAASYAIVSSYKLTGSILNKNETNVSLSGTPILITSSLISICLYRTLGGRFVSVLPSHLCSPGAFGRQWIPAGSNYANVTEKKIIQVFGNKHGCHSCGKRRGVVNFAADHQPPSTINSGKEIQRFYPHCDKCSGLQGGVLSGNSKSDSMALITHPFSLRLYHLFLPVPLGLALLRPFLMLSRDDKPTNNELVINEGPETTNEIIPLDNHFNDVTTKEVNKHHLSDVIGNFPILIIWNKIMVFLDSLHPIAQFHLTLWTFSVFAAFGS